MLHALQERPRREHEQQGEQRVGVVEAEDQDGHGCQCHDERRDDAGHAPEGAPDRGEQHEHRGHAHDRLRQQIDHELRPKRRTDRPRTIVESGGLSTVMKLPASSEPKNQALQLCEAACAAGRSRCSRSR